MPWKPLVSQTQKNGKILMPGSLELANLMMQNMLRIPDREFLKPYPLPPRGLQPARTFFQASSPQRAEIKFFAPQRSQAGRGKNRCKTKILKRGQNLPKECPFLVLLGGFSSIFWPKKSNPVGFGLFLGGCRCRWHFSQIGWGEEVHTSHIILTPLFILIAVGGDMG